MTRITLSASILAMAAIAQPVWSLTAEETWESWQQISQEFGQTVTAGSTSKSGNVLTLSDVTYTLVQDEVALSGSTEVIRLTEQADGSVVMTGSDESSLVMTVMPENEEPVEARVRYGHPDLEVTVSETGGMVSYAYLMPQLVLDLLEAKVAGEVVPLNGKLEATGVAGEYASSGGVSPTITQTYRLQTLTLALDGPDPETGGQINMQMELASLAGSGESTGGSLYSGGDIGDLLKAGLTTRGSVVSGPFSVAFDGTNPREQVSFRVSAQSANGAGSLDREKMNYSVNYNGMEVEFSGSEVPLPVVTGAIGDLGVTLLVPLAQSEQAQPFAFNMTLGDMVAGDPVWNLFDPAAILPRDPSTIVFDLAGQAKVLLDILDIDDGMPVQEPAQLEALSINRILVELAGASLLAEGGFTFDNTDTSTFDGMPRPEGTLNVTLQGANALLDKLVQMGLLPADQAMGARMMSGMILRPGAGEDELVSEIEVTPEGRVLANGQPLPF